MKRKWFYFFLAFILICTTLIFLVIQQDADQGQPDIASKQEIEPALEEERGAVEENESNPENQETEQQTLPQQGAEALNSTVEFFTNKPAHIVAIGDSLTQGVGDETDQDGYVGIIERTINDTSQLVQIDNYGVRGNRTDQLLKRLENEEISLAIEDSDMVLITIGANDIMQVAKENIAHLVLNDFVKERDKYEERLRGIFDKIRELNPNTEIYLVGFYNPFQAYFEDIKELDLIVETWNTTGKNVSSSYENTTFIPTVDLFSDPDADLFSDDNFHPNYEGYYRMAERVLDYIIDREG